MLRSVVFVVVLLASCTSSGDASKSRHAFVIGIDGVRVDALMVADTPRIDALIAAGTISYDAMAGGERGEVTEQPTFSGPGWSSILTGVWADKHRVELNVFDDANFDDYPHFFARLREKKPEAYLSSFVTWAPINESILASAEGDAAFTWDDPSDSAGGDIAVTAAVVDHFRVESPDAVFVHLDEVDHQGHLVGFSPDVPEYIDAIETVDAQIDEMLDAIEARPTYADEEWLIVVTTDHGGIGQGHGGQSEEERTIFMLVTGGGAAAGGVISPGPGHTAVPPTLMKHLRLPIEAEWGWESDPFGL
jgi:predicted AlkP superfamily pyrophosphatase or phosphodiesterase